MSASWKSQWLLLAGHDRERRCLLIVRFGAAEMLIPMRRVVFQAAPLLVIFFALVSDS